MRWIGQAALALAVIAGGPVDGALAAKAPRPPPLFEWSTPSAYGAQRDARGIVVETDPARVPTGPWRVRLQVVPTSCREHARYRWSVKGRPLRTTKGPGCAFEAKFRTEDATYPVRLEIESEGKLQVDQQPITVQDWLVVSLGDSVASGEGLPDVPGFSRSVWQSVPCHRSTRAAPAKAARQIEEQDPHTSVTFVHLACSGATIPQGLLGSYDGVLKEAFSQPQPAQVKVLNRLAAKRKVDAVLLSVGANDVYFGDIVKHCATRRSRDCFGAKLNVAGGRTIEDSVRLALAALKLGYDELNAEIDQRIARPRVHIADYFDPTRDAKGRTCERIFGFVGAAELESAQSRVLEPLNDAVLSAADRHGWTPVTGIANRFREHGYCAARQAWVTTLSGSAARSGGPVEGRFLGTLHPNEAGQDAIAAEIVASLQRSLYPGREFEPVVGGPEPLGDEDGLPVPVIVLIVLGGLLVVGLVAGLGWSIGRRQTR